MDYWEKCDVRRWRSFEELRAVSGDVRFFYLTTKAQRPYWDAEFRDGDHLVFGRETRGLPASLLEAERAHLLTIPMAREARSQNLAASVGIVLYEACRQVRMK
jgi:tRNA (cytidine/uridine-2'-O-)-methyltransferase